MKTILFYLAAAASILSFNIQASAIGPLKGSSNTEFGDYTLSVSNEQIENDGKSLDTYILEYTNVKIPVKIGVEETKFCRNFIVRYPFFEMKYVCSKRGLGARRVDPGSETISPVVVNALLDERQLAYQEIIINKAISDEEALQYIACYFPLLINKELRNNIN